MAQPPNPSTRANPARGVALIATAVILGFFVLRNAWDQGVPVVATNDGTAEEASDSDDEAPDDADDGEGDENGEETPAARPPDEITVLVANTTAFAGAAANWTTLLSQGGYQTVDPTNADESRDTTAVFFVDGFEIEAAELAEGMSPADVTVEVAALPDPPPVDPGGAQLVVLLGDDLAEGAAG